MENNETLVLELKKYYLDDENMKAAINEANEAQDELFGLFDDFSNKYEESEDDSLFDTFSNEVKKHIQKYKNVSEFVNKESTKLNENLNKLESLDNKNDEINQLIQVLDNLGNTLEGYSRLLNLSIKTIKEIGGIENE